MPLTFPLRSSLIFIALLCCYATNVKSAELTGDNLFDMSLEELLTVSVASKRQEDIKQAPAIVSVITAGDIRKFGYNSLKDILERSPHLQIVGSNLFPHNKSTIRGINNTHLDATVLLQINGRPIREAELSSMNHDIYNFFPVNAIKQIEIIRGPGSVLYGTNALAGVINIVTYDGSEHGLSSLALTAGTFNSQKLEGNLSTQVGDTKIFAAFSGRKTDGDEFPNIYDEFGTLGTYPMGKEGYQMFVKAEHHGFTLNALVADSTTEHVRSVFAYPSTENDYERLYVDLGYKHSISKDWQLKFNALYQDASAFFEALPLPSVPLPRSTINNILAEASVQGSLTDNANILFGMSFEKSKNDREVGFESTSKSFYSQLDWQSQDWLKLIFGAQYNIPDEADSHWSPRLGAIIKLNEKWGIKFLYSDAFREASPLDRFIDVPGIVGDSELEPETISNVDAQLYYQSPNATFALTAFRSEHKNLISRELGFPVKIVNGGEITYQGIEVEGRKDLSATWSLTGNATYQTNEDHHGEEGVTFAPEVMLKIGASYHSKYATVGAFASHFGRSAKQNDVLNETRSNPDPEAYTLLTFNANTRLSDFTTQDVLKNVELSVHLDNVLDEKVYFPSINRTNVNSLPHHSGRSVSATAKFNF